MAFSLLAVSYQLPSIAQTNSPPPNKQSERKESNSLNERVTSESQPRENPADTQNSKQEDIPEKRLYHRYLRATILGVCVSALLFAALIWQNILTRITAKAAQDGAAAANKSADTLRIIERAWLIIWYENFIHVDYQIPGSNAPAQATASNQIPSQPLGESGLLHKVNWHAQNIGKTPAFITETWSRFIEIKNIAELPAEPDYSRVEPTQYQGDPLRPDERSYWITTDIEFNPRFGNTTFEDIEERHRSKKTVIFAYGYVRYRDAFGERRETRFGIVYAGQPELSFSLDGWRVAGPEAYNRHT